MKDIEMFTPKLLNKMFGKDVRFSRGLPYFVENVDIDKEKAFMIGLTELSRATGVTIFGCGCCGSPSLKERDTSNPNAGYGKGYADEVAWISPEDEYSWEEYSDSIVKEKK